MASRYAALGEAALALEPTARNLEPPREVRTTMTTDVAQFANAFIDELEAGTLPAWEPFTAAEVTGPVVAAGIPEDGCRVDDASSSLASSSSSWEKVLGDVREHIITPGINPASGGMFGYVPGGGVFPSALADFISSITNRYAGMFFACPGAVRLETMLVRWAAEVMGVAEPEKCLGCLTSGASIATLSAFVCARERYAILTGGKDGNTLATRFCVYTTDQAHSCIKKALNMCGMGHLPFRHVRRDTKLRMDIDGLKEAIAEDRGNGLVPFMIVAAAGTTNSGSVDPLEGIAAVAKSEGMWFHIDAAYGGLYALCPEGRAAMGPGLALGDSIVADPHKALFLPYGTGMLLVRDGELLRSTHGITAAYLSRFVDNTEEVSSVDLSPELTRHFRALRLWLPLRTLGAAAFRASQSEKLILAQYFAEKLPTVDSRFVVYGPPDLGIVMYRVESSSADGSGAGGAELQSINVTNQAICDEVLRGKKVFISTTTLDGTLWLRLAVGVFRSHKEHVDLAVDELRRSADVVGVTRTPTKE